jgi:hypothetical protein
VEIAAATFIAIATSGGQITRLEFWLEREPAELALQR